ncbi:MAG: small multi-drug export protein [Methanocorpusculum sp.]|nr:small multi-drug export protein [Methanocorpusculum sp.]
MPCVFLEQDYAEDDCGEEVAVTEEAGYYKPSLRVRMIFSFGILAVLAVFVGVMYLSFPPETFALYMGLFAVYMAPGAGKESIVPLLTAVGCPLAAIVCGIVIIDMALGIIISLNFDLLLRIPVLGKILGIFTRKAGETLHKYPWIAGLASAGLFLFMYIPFMGSSSINTSIVGRIISMHPKVLLPIIIAGSLMATLTVAVGVQAVIRLWLVNPWYAVVAVAVAAVVVFVVWRLWRKYVTPRFRKKENGE